MRASKSRVQGMKGVYFYALFAAIAALQSILILSGFLPSLLSYSAGNILFGLVVVALLVYMGWSFDRLSLKKIAVKGTIAAVISSVIISIATLIGHEIMRPILGISLSSTYYLPIYLLAIALLSIMVYIFFTAVGAWLAHNAEHPKKTR